MKLHRSTILLGSVLLLAASPAWARKWTDNAGKFSVEAELVEIKDDSVVLKKSTGSLITVPIARLSAADRGYLRSLKQSAPEPAADSGQRGDLTPPQGKPVWTMSLSRMKANEAQVSGSIHGQGFTPDKAELDNGILTLREGKDFFPDRSVKVFLFLAEDETVVGKTYRIAAQQGFGVPHVRIQWKKEGSTFGESETFMNEYAMALAFGKSQGGQLPGKIYLSVPDKSKSVIAGAFSVEIFDATHPETTQTEISGNVILQGKHKNFTVSVGCLGKNKEGKLEAPGVGFKLDGSTQSSTSGTWKPRNSTLAWDEQAGHGSHKHIHRPPGHYLVHIRGRADSGQGGSLAYEGYYDWKWVELKDDTSKVKVDLTIDPDNTGSVEVSLSDPTAAKTVTYLPLNEQGKLPLPEADCHRYVQSSSRAKLVDGKAVIKHLRPGKYQFATGRGDRKSPFGYAITAKAEVEVKPGTTVKVELTPKKPSPAPAAKTRPTAKTPSTSAKKKNLMSTARYTASSTWNHPGLTAPKAFDGHSRTRWNSKPGDAKRAWLAACWDQPVTVTEVVVRQAYDRITAFRIQQLDAVKNDWVDVVLVEGDKLTALKGGKSASGPDDGSVSPVFRVSFPRPVRTTGIRMLVTEVVNMRKGTISIYEMEAY